MESPFPKPPWQVFPYPWGSLGWRMGAGERRWQEFTDWFRSHSPDARARFAATNPEPPGWRYFYEFICLERDDGAGRDRLQALIRANWHEYQAAEYDCGRRAEEAGDLPTALSHFGNANEHGDFEDVAERYERVRQELAGGEPPNPFMDSSVNRRTLSAVEFSSLLCRYNRNDL